MTLDFSWVIAVALAYVTFLFAVAFMAERRAAAGNRAWLNSPLIYTLSLSIYCTAWTFYGAVGYAARSGLEFVTIYLGPTLVMVGWWIILRRLVRIGKTQRITSIADLISSRFGKSTLLGVVVTLMAIVAATPYIALQLQSVTLSFSVFAENSGVAWDDSDLNANAIWVAVGLAVFTVLFGTRNLDANERHNGIVIAIAVEAIVKLVALLAVGIFVVWGLGGGVAATLTAIETSPISAWNQGSGRWISLIFLSAAAFLCLPRMFQVLVVENADERHLQIASWAFPAYLFLMSLFVLPIAVVGLNVMPITANPDLFVLTLPLRQGENGLAVLSFLGGFSSATSMVIVATIALATMVSNHIVLPIWLRSGGDEGASRSGDVRRVIIISRRLSIAAILTLGYFYYRLSGGGTALAAIGLISFTGAVQVLPAMLGGIFWRGATRLGAAAGLLTGFGVWVWALFLPSFGPGAVIPLDVMSNGPFGMTWLRPEAFFGITGIDPLVHGLLWSMLLNSVMFFVVSILTFPSPLERLQGAQFVNVFEHSGATPTWSQSAANAEDLLIMSQRIIGSAEAQTIFQAAAAAQGKQGYLPDVTPDFVARLERELAGSVGAATAHAMVGRMTQGASVSVEDLIAVADEAAQIMEYSNKLEAKSAEQERTARALRDANAKLTALSVQKDAFLSQISHELRTPMTSIRSFSEILRDMDMTAEEKARHAGIIHDESMRLTRLLDDLLDLSVLENGQVTLHEQTCRLSELLDRAVGSAGLHDKALIIKRKTSNEDITLTTDTDRLCQVFINLIANASKYCDADQPTLRIRAHLVAGSYVVDFIDNGSGIETESQQMIFEKFARLTDHARAGGAGLGLAICREVMARLGGRIAYLPGQGGGAFRVTLPAPQAVAAQ
ncbi:His Kinase A (phospho-acceptor) domain-containing protein [Cognatiyoonia koreensis]|uniref:histidine kinase n=1 Tax=Cognatiyoonia koreensis TaxID=364200 RepID=A0A1I0Q006_9RHOB|nr:ATP-binding protein [Cognatiyoonia koreensis]SEW20115.1 His Kinase A (phospho-acceptor) domain-containing protein [Cognatiyoonia koreensis]